MTKFKVGDYITHTIDAYESDIFRRIWLVKSTKIGITDGYLLKLISSRKSGGFELGTSHIFSKDFVEMFYILIDEIHVVTMSL